MPFQNSWFLQDYNAVLVTPRGLMNSKNNRFDKTSNEGTRLEEWDDWIRWEGGATNELLPSSIESVKSTASTLSSPDTWTRGLETSGIDMISDSYPNIGEFPFDDAPFELDGTPSTSNSSTKNHELPTYPLTTIYSAQTQQQDLRRSYRKVSSLTAAEEKALQDIAMPYRELSSINLGSAATFPMESQSFASPSAFPEPEIRSRKNKKRKSVDLGEPPSTTLCQSRKSGHNAIEKRYRTNLNAKIECLREGVPSLCDVSANAGEEDSDGEDRKAAGQQKYGKAAILTRALEYIQHLEGTTRRLGGEVDTLKTRVGAFEKLAMSGSIVLHGNGMDVMSRQVLIKSETIRSIQSEFQQIKPKAKVANGPTTRKRGSRQTKDL